MHAWGPDLRSPESKFIYVVSTSAAFLPTLLSCFFLTVCGVPRHIMIMSPLSDNWLKLLSQSTTMSFDKQRTYFCFLDCMVVILHDWFLFLTSLPPEVGTMASCNFSTQFQWETCLLLYWYHILSVTCSIFINLDVGNINSSCLFCIEATLSIPCLLYFYVNLIILPILTS